MYKYVKASEDTQQEYLGVKYIVTPSRNGAGYVFVIPVAKGIKGLKASGFNFQQAAANEDAKAHIEKFIKYAINAVVNAQQVTLTPCPQCGVADYYDEDSGVCANCGYYRDAE